MAAQAELRQPGGGGTIRLTAGAALAAGEVVPRTTRIAVVAGTQAVANGDKYTALTDGVFDMISATADTWSDKALLYWDDTANNLTVTAAGNTRAGEAVGAKSNGQTRALCDISHPATV